MHRKPTRSFVVIIALTSLVACSAPPDAPAPAATHPRMGEVINPPSPSAGNGSLVFSVANFGAKGDGATDDSTAVLAAIAAANTAGGGTVYFPQGTYRIDSQILLPNDSTSIPAQKPIRITGTTAYKTGQAAAPTGGSILDLRYNSTDGKITSFGQGHLEIDHLTLEETGSTRTSPFIYSTLTTLSVHDVAFFGYSGKTGTVCDQDVMILGGTSTTLSGADTSPFSGYGTVIENNYADHIRRFAYLQTYANALQIVNNTIWFNSGSNLTAGAAIEINGVSGNQDSGNWIAGNLIEMVGYPYAFKLTQAVLNTFVGNSLYDATLSSPTLGYYWFDSTAPGNTVISGFVDSGIPMMTDATSGDNAVSVALADQREEFNSLALLRNDGGSHGNRPVLTIQNTNTGGSFAHRAELDFTTPDASGTNRTCSMLVEGGNLTLTPYSAMTIVGAVTVSAGSTTLQADSTYGVEISGSSSSTSLGNGQVSLQLNNSNSTTNNNESIVFRSQTSQTSSIESRTEDQTNHYADLWFMTRGSDGYAQRFHLDGTHVDAVTQRIINVVDPSGAQDAATKNYVDTKTVTIPGTSLTWTSGAGAPSGSCATGSIYSNTSGSVLTTLYVCTGSSTWTAK